MRRVVCAALRENGSIITGARHFDSVMHQQIRRTRSILHHVLVFLHLRNQSWIGAEQGFIDQKGKFLNREEAYVIAEAAGQVIGKVIPRRCGRPELYSENLYEGY